MKFLTFAASLRKDSFNKKLIAIAEDILKNEGMEIDHADFSEFSAPLYNADVQNNIGFPEEIKGFTQRLLNSDACIISSPEYNHSIPGTLKNLVDWVSRLEPMPWKNQVIFLMSASPALVGGNRGLWNTRIPLEACGAFVYPDMFSLASAHLAFDENQNLKEKQLLERFKNNLVDFIQFAKTLKTQ